MKQLKFNTEARNKLLNGINIVAEAVGSTLGPRGRNVAVDNIPDYDVPPTVLHDGVSVARSINLEDNFEDMGARLLKDAAIKTNEKAGDGTTTATVLAQAIIAESFKIVEAGNNPQTLKKEIEEAAKKVIAELKTKAKEISTNQEMAQVATISAADHEIGKLVAEALAKVGKDGVITVEEGKSLETIVEYKQGMEIDRGYLSPYFVTNQAKVEAVLEQPYILLTDKKINYGHEILPFLEKFVKAGKKDLVIFAGEVIEEALATLVVNKLKGTLNVVAIQAPAFGGRRVDELQDIATLIGGQAILADSGREIKSVELEELGRAEKIIADRDKTIIINGHGNKEAVKKRIEELKEQIKIPNTGFDKDIKEERLANLAGSIAVINVGAATEVELKEKKERVIDAVNATKAAVEEGIVAGGEVSLLYLALQAPEKPQEAFSVGKRILLSALKAPFRRLMENSGLDYAEALQKLSGKDYPFGIDVKDFEVKDLISSGIIDPIKVTRYALENAVSVAIMVITTDTLITDVIKEDK